ncbi:cysteine--1-D-myo-inosityl 2-amino-2-deoxy-alpha-D-glucopyranoside ligase [Brevibacterium casei]|uniref:cysteine--1-D-myo-inosityl 2-amino-2-deoxy-alpha-D-glucopyranoside ligase n=1 Tax=Brevibacterium casei TaxID=33889 RepID=UPI0021B04F87|nr:cysteine--1-D-myo-inosityl 2-amino-2-deoxy-alpha-D-glucopyranoside ligase [Brevibacterium casei]MCT2182299.1 cysteine--1-D-myo-inosityl 2-amino-2-deoxy-alpha-D-glucopyranoside ligase [Brevibacterium casei]
MKSWSAPELPSLSTPGILPTVFDTGARSPRKLTGKDGTATLYVCGITPYDATHLGHAATYVAFDLLGRVWRDAGLDVVYVQNTTDVDDPLLERAEATGVDWRELADSQIQLFRDDMEALRVVPPQDYVGVVESIPQIAEAVAALIEAGAAYTLETGDVYYRVATPVQPPFGSVSHDDKATMLRLSAERGGDPETPGKENPLDPLLWRAARDGEPSWDGGSLGPGRPGWHLECTVIAEEKAGLPVDVQGGGSDLVFPHHEMGAAHSAAWLHRPLAKTYMHTGMVGYQGEKMSKSKGNLVLVSQLLAEGVDPMVIRTVLLSNHYRSDWMFTPELLEAAEKRLAAWRHAADREAECREGLRGHIIALLREALADDLDSPRALGILDEWAEHYADSPAGDAGPVSGDRVADAVDSLLGIRLRD